MSSKRPPLMKLIRGEHVQKPLYFEVWFARRDFVNRLYGDYRLIENRIKMALDVGLSGLSLGTVPTNVLFQQYNDEADGGQSRYGGGSLRNREQMTGRELPDPTEWLPKWKDDCRKIQQAGLACWVVLPWCFHAAATSIGLESFCYLLVDDKGFVEDVMEWIEQRNRWAIKTVIKEVKPDFVLFDSDCAYKTGPMVNISMLKDLTFERTRETVRLLRELDIPYLMHTDGKIDEVIPMAIELGFSAIHGCEMAANDLGDLVERFGDEICLIGNMSLEVMVNASPEEVSRKTVQMIDTGMRKGRYAVSLDTACPDYIPDENYYAYVEAIKNY